MPFALKKAGVTYQRLMDRILSPMLGWNVQAYVDDMVVTSVKASEHMLDLEELFATIRVRNLKLNPKKCVFGVQAWRFLDFLLTERGIKANPNKCDEKPNQRKGSVEVNRVHGRSLLFPICQWR